MWRIIGAISALVKSSTADESKDLCFYVNSCKYALKCLKILHSRKDTKNDTLVFPGVMAGWESEQEAKDNSVNWCTEEKMKNFDTRYGEETRKSTYHDSELSMVMFKINTKSFRSVVCREFVHRLNAKVEEYHLSDDGVHVFTLSEVEPMSLDDWNAKYPAEAKEDEAEM